MAAAKNQNPTQHNALLKPIDIKRLARVPYTTVIGWLEAGHPKAGILPSIDLASTGESHIYRIRREDWEAFQAKLATIPERHRQLLLPPHPEHGAVDPGALPEELTTKQAAQVLGCDKKTVIRYVRGGHLEWRNTASPGSTRPVYKIRLSSVLELRVAYKRGPEVPAAPDASLEKAPRRRVAMSSGYHPKHIRSRPAT